MKPKEKKPKTVFRIIDNETGEAEGSYSRSYCDEFDFSSLEGARDANCHGVYKDKVRYGIAKYRVTYELIEEDVDPPNDEEIAKADEQKEFERKADELGLEGFERFRYLVNCDLFKELSKKVKEANGS